MGDPVAEKKLSRLEEQGIDLDEETILRSAREKLERKPAQAEPESRMTAPVPALEEQPAPKPEEEKKSEKKEQVVLSMEEVRALILKTVARETVKFDKLEVAQEGGLIKIEAEISVTGFKVLGLGKVKMACELINSIDNLAFQNLSFPETKVALQKVVRAQLNLFSMKVNDALQREYGQTPQKVWIGKNGLMVKFEKEGKKPEAAAAPEAAPKKKARKKKEDKPEEEGAKTLTPEEIKNAIINSLSGQPGLTMEHLQVSGLGEIMKLEVKLTATGLGEIAFGLEVGNKESALDVKKSEISKGGRLGLAKSAIQKYIANFSSEIQTVLEKRFGRLISKLSVAGGNLVIEFAPAQKPTEIQAAAAPAPEKEQARQPEKKMPETRPAPVESTDQAEMERRLNEARRKLARAQLERQRLGLMSKVLGTVLRTESYNKVKAELEQADRQYRLLRAEFISAEIERFLQNEEMSMEKTLASGKEGNLTAWTSSLFESHQSLAQYVESAAKKQNLIGALGMDLLPEGRKIALQEKVVRLVEQRLLVGAFEALPADKHVEFTGLLDKADASGLTKFLAANLPNLPEGAKAEAERLKKELEELAV